MFPNIGKEVDLEEWVHGQGIPADAIEPKSKTLTKVKSLAEGFAGGVDLTADDVAKWRAAEWQIYLEALPLVLPHERIAALDAQFSLSTVRTPIHASMHAHSPPFSPSLAHPRCRFVVA